MLACRAPRRQTGATIKQLSRTPAVALREAVCALLLLAAAGLTSFSVYRQTLGYGFDYDDYHFVRPIHAGEVAAAFRGPWDPLAIETPYFRPLTVAAFAARYDYLGLNARAYHALSLGLFTVASCLAGAFAWRATRRVGAGLFAAALFAAHPAMPYALAAWVTNQMHLLGIVIVLLALLWWDAVRARPLPWWMPLLLAASAAFLVKEDGIMLLPTLAALHWIRRRLLEPDLPPMPIPFLAASVLLIAALVVVRTEALSGVRPAHVPGAAQAWQNVTLGLNRVFRLVPADRPWQPAASWFVTVLPVAALGVWRRASHGSRFLLAAGATIALLFNLPFVLITKHEQMHVVAFGAVLVLTGSAAALWDALPFRAARFAVAAVLAAGGLACGVVARDISTDFAPFSPVVLSHDAMVTGWAAVPLELREYLLRKLEPGSGHHVPANPVDSVPLVVFGVHAPEVSPSGVRYRWMSSARAELEVAASAREVIVPLRHEAGAFKEPARADVRADGVPIDSIGLPDGEWRVSRIPLRRDRVPALRRTHRIVISIDHAWIPAEVFPGSTDTRVLGLQIGAIELR